MVAALDRAEQSNKDGFFSGLPPFRGHAHSTALLRTKPCSLAEH
jgi:hypothetical protein